MSNINISTTRLSKCLIYNSINDSVSDFTLTNTYKSISVETFVHKKECKNNMPQKYVIKSLESAGFFRGKPTQHLYTFYHYRNIGMGLDTSVCGNSRLLKLFISINTVIEFTRFQQTIFMVVIKNV